MLQLASKRILISIFVAAPKISPEFCKVRWKEMSASDVFNLYRSLYTFKNLSTCFNDQVVKLIELRFEPNSSSSNDTDDEKHGETPVGLITFCKKTKRLLVKCADESFIEVVQLSIGKKKAMSAVDFNNGFLRKCSASCRIFQ